jgi:hypothetical protein
MTLKEWFTKRGALEIKETEITELSSAIGVQEESADPVFTIV